MMGLNPGMMDPTRFVPTTTAWPPPVRAAIRSAESLTGGPRIRTPSDLRPVLGRRGRLIGAVRDDVDRQPWTPRRCGRTRKPAPPSRRQTLAAKLSGIGLPLATLLADQLGYTPTQIERIEAIREREALRHGDPAAPGTRPGHRPPHRPTDPPFEERHLEDVDIFGAAITDLGSAVDHLHALGQSRTWRTPGG